MAPKFTAKHFYEVVYKAETATVPQNLQKYLGFLIAFYCKLKNKDLVNMTLEYMHVDSYREKVSLNSAGRVLEIHNKRLFCQIKRYILQNFDTGHLYRSFYCF